MMNNTGNMGNDDEMDGNDEEELINDPTNELGVPLWLIKDMQTMALSKSLFTVSLTRESVKSKKTRPLNSLSMSIYSNWANEKVKTMRSSKQRNETKMETMYKSVNQETMDFSQNQPSNQVFFSEDAMFTPSPPPNSSLRSKKSKRNERFKNHIEQPSQETVVLTEDQTSVIKPTHHPEIINNNEEENGKIQAMKILLTTIRLVKFYRSSKKLYFAEVRPLSLSARKIQREWLKHRQLKKSRDLRNILRCSLRIVLQCRIIRKRLAMRLLIDFFKRANDSYRFVIHRFLNRVRVIQGIARSFLEITRARKACLQRLWEKWELRTRKRFDIKERNAIKRMGLVKSRGSKRDNVHTKWSKLNNKVMQFTSVINNVEYHYKMVSSVGPHQPVLTENDVEVWNVITDRVDERTKEDIIHRTLIGRRKLHIATLNELNQVRVKTAKGLVSEENVRNFLHDNDNMGYPMEILVSCQLGSLQAQSLAAKHALESEILPPITLPFLCLTSSKLGRTWRSLVEEIVKAHIIQRKADILDEIQEKTKNMASASPTKEEARPPSSNKRSSRPNTGKHRIVN